MDVQAPDVAVALQALSTVVSDDEKLADRVWELTEDEIDPGTVDLENDDETTAGRLVRAAKLLVAALERAHREGAGLLAGTS